MSSLSLIFTLIALLILVTFVIIGYINGILRILFTTFSLVITILAAALLAQTTATFLHDKTFIGKKVDSSIYTYVEEQLEEKVAENLEEDSFISNLSLPSILKDKIRANNTIEKYTELGVTTFSQYITVQLSSVVMTALAFILLFIVLSVGLNIIYGVIKLISKIPILKGINRFLGGLFGLAEGLIVLWCICIMIMVFSGTATGAACMKVINGSPVLSFIYENNVPVMIFKSFLTIL